MIDDVIYNSRGIGIEPYKVNRVIPPHVFRYPRIWMLWRCPRIRKSGPAYSRMSHGTEKNHHHTLQHILRDILHENFRIRVVWRRYPEKMSGYVNPKTYPRIRLRDHSNNAIEVDIINQKREETEK